MSLRSARPSLAEHLASYQSERVSAGTRSRKARTLYRQSKPRTRPLKSSRGPTTPEASPLCGRWGGNRNGFPLASPMPPEVFGTTTFQPTGGSEGRFPIASEHAPIVNGNDPIHQLANERRVANEDYLIKPAQVHGPPRWVALQSFRLSFLRTRLGRFEGLLSRSHN
jgi:hypothetical protein